MKVKNAKQNKAKSNKNSGVRDQQDIYQRPKGESSKEKIQPLDMFNIEVISNKSDNNNAGTVDFVISAETESLLKMGFSKLIIKAKTDIQSLGAKSKLTLRELEELFKQRGIPSDEVTFEVDLMESIDKKRLNSLINDLEESLEITDPEFTFDIMQSANKIEENIYENSVIVFPKSVQDDKLGILEIRLGNLGQNFQRESIQENSLNNNPDNPYSVIDQNRLDSFSDLGKPFDNSNFIRPESPLQKLLKSKSTNNNNKRKPTLITKTQLAFSVNETSPGQNIQIPLIKNIKMENRKKITAYRKRFSLPGPKSNFSIEIENNAGNVQKKAFPLVFLNPVQKSKTYRFLSDDHLPKIDATSIGNNQVMVSVQNIDNSTSHLDIYRREISTKPAQDSYERIAKVKDPFGVFSFIDFVESKKAYKYVCVANKLPLFTYFIYKTPDYEYSSYEEPFIFAYQKDIHAELFMTKVPDSIRKLLIYRKSSVDSLEELINGVNVVGRTPPVIKITDKPVPGEQELEYSIVGIDESGIQIPFEDRPSIYYNTKLGTEDNNITGLNIQYNQDDHTVEIDGEARVDNIFIPTSDTELRNPSLGTLDAANRGQLIVKIQIRRINKTHEEDEIIVKEIINPGLSAFETELKALDRIKFKFKDSIENSSIFGYTPLKDFCDYVYVARMIIYPLGLELRKVSDYEYIKPPRAPGRLPYQYDPGIFDHPLTRELGILPSSPSTKNYILADIVGQTSGIEVRDIKTATSLNEQNFSIDSEIKIDDDLTPLVLLNISLPSSMIDNLDHVEIVMGYDTVASEDIIDRVFIIESGGNFKYYDYSFLDLAANSVYYKIVGIGKDFKTLFTSSKAFVNLNDPILEKAIRRKKALATNTIPESKNLKKSKIMNKVEEMILRRK